MVATDIVHLFAVKSPSFNSLQNYGSSGVPTFYYVFDVVTGVEDADDADEREVHTHEIPEDDVPGEYLELGLRAAA